VPRNEEVEEEDADADLFASPFDLPTGNDLEPGESTPQLP